MKQRLPRKAKKRVNKKLKFLNASRMIQSALVSATSMAQVAQISAMPRPYDILPSAHIGLKALKTAQIVSETGLQIQKILSEKPNHWKDFLSTPKVFVN